MKKYLLSLLFVVFMFPSCDFHQRNLENMGYSVKNHFKEKDVENGTITKFETLKALSYEEIPEDKRNTPEEYYVCKVYIKGTWSYMGGFRVYNMDDTLNSYFTKDKVFIRIENKNE